MSCFLTKSVVSKNNFKNSSRYLQLTQILLCQICFKS